MTKVNNGRITSTSGSVQNKSKTRAKAAAVLAKLDEMSASLADDISHYEDDATFDFSVKEETNTRVPSVDVMKRLEKVSESRIVMYNDDEGSCGVESNDESTVYEEISYGLSRMNEASKADELKPKVIPVQDEHEELKEQLGLKKSSKKRAPSSTTPLLPVLTEEKNEELEDLHNMHSCSFDDESSDGGFSIEEAEEEEIITETTAVLARPPPVPKRITGSKKAKGHGSEKPKHERSVDKYVHSLSMDDSVLDDASILDMQMTKTPKIRNNKKSLVGKKGGFNANSTASSAERSSLFPPHLMASGASSGSSSGSALSAKSGKSSASTKKSETSRRSLGLFSRAAPKDKKARDEGSEVSQFNPPSHLSIDIESARSSRRGTKRGNTSSSSSRVSSALSFGDETDDIIRAAIVIKNDNAKRRRKSLVCGVVIVFLAALSVLGTLVLTDSVPGFLREPLAKAGVVPPSPTAESDPNIEPKGVVGVAWYANFDLFKCVQDCDESSKSATCGGKMETWEKGFVTLEECCLENFSTFIGNDWSLRDCVALSDSDPLDVADADSTDVPTYMPTAGEIDNESNGQDEEDGDNIVSDKQPVAGTTPWAKGPDEDTGSSEYVLELDENFQPINPTTAATQDDETVTTTVLPTEGEGADEPQSVFRTTAWAVETETDHKDGSGYVLELDENFNPINPTTVAATIPDATEHTSIVTTIAASEEDHIASFSENMNATASLTNKTIQTNSTEAEDDSYTLVYYADWKVNQCLLKGNDELQAWQKTYTTENECCADNFEWDVNGNCFQTKTPVTSTPTSTVSPSYQPSLQPTISSEPTRPVLVWIHFNQKCIKVQKTSLKNNAVNWESQDDCHLHNNLGEYQPTEAPSLSPTKAPSFSPTVSPTFELTAAKADMNTCTVEFCQYEMTTDYKLEYKVNVPNNNVSIEDCIGCSLSVKLTYDGETSWIGFAFSTSGEMIGSEAIIGVPGMTPAKYHLTGKFETAVQPMSADKQTLIEPLIDVVDGQTVMSFTKLLVEDGEIMVSTGNNIFLWAHGSDVENTYHGQNKGSFNINLLKSGSSHSGDAADSVEVRNEVIDKPTNRPTMKTTVKSTPKPSNKATSKPSIKPTARSTLAPTAKPTSGTTSQDSLMELLLSRSPNTNSTAMRLDTSSAQHLAWRWLKKNPDLSTISDERKVQRWALVTVYRALHGDEWTYGEGWLEISDAGVDECTWYNILCDSEGSVVSIDLRNNYLWGDTPMELSLLDKCEFLGLSSNYLRTIQPAIFDMGSLKVLDMNDNGIEEIPSEINTSLGLEKLYLGHNNIAIIPEAIFKLQSLKVLYMPDNWISVPVSTKIGQLMSLEVLDLEMNYITGELPSEIGLLKNLNELQLSRNMISGQLPTELVELTSLTILDFSMNHLDSNIIPDIGALDSLVALRLDNNYRLDENGTLISSGISGTIPASIGNLKQLKELRLDNNFVQGPLPSALGDLSSIEILRIESNDVHGNIPSELGNAVNLRFLHLWSNYIQGTIPNSLGNLEQLQELFLDDNEMTGVIPSDLGRLASLDYLALASNNLESTIPSELGLLPALTKLELQSNYLYGEVPMELGSSSLVILQLEDNYLYGDIPEQVCKSNTIKYISGSCPVLPEEPTPSPVSSNMDNAPITQASVSARNGVTVNNNNARTRTRTNGTRANGNRNNGGRANYGRNRVRDGTRQRNKETSRELAQGVPTPSPTLEYWWSCNCCSECLPVQ